MATGPRWCRCGACPPADQALLMAFEVRASLFGSDDPGVVALWRRFQERCLANGREDERDAVPTLPAPPA